MFRKHVLFSPAGYNAFLKRNNKKETMQRSWLMKEGQGISETSEFLLINDVAYSLSNVQ
jgi:hypothetical protein